MTQQQQNGSFQQPKMAQGLMVEDDIEFPLSLFTIPRCYQEDLSAVLIPYGLIQDRIRKLAQEIYVQIGDQPLTMICVLKGSFRFFTHLLEQISEMRWNCQSPIQVEFIRAQSYMDQGSTGSLSIVGLEALEKGTNTLKAKQVLLVDDIIDTGLTISKLSAELRQKIGQDGRLWTALLVSKRTDQRMPMDSCRADFVAFNIPNKFIVGYGMDYNQMFRDLSHICVMNQRGIKKYATAEPK